MVSRKLAFLFFAAWFAHAPAQTLRIESLTAADGLSQGMIHAMLQDRRGFLWLGTRDGLNRYDGYRFEVFQNDPFDPFSLADNVAVALLEDARGRLWVGSENNGVSVLDPETGLFYHLGTGAGKLSHAYVTALAETPDGAVWVGTAQGANRVVLPSALPADSPELGGIAQVETFFWEEKDAIPYPPANAISGLLAHRDGSLWCFTARQGFRLDLKTGRRDGLFDCDPNGQNRCSLAAISLCQTPDGSVWAAEIHALYCVRPGSNSPIAVPYPPDLNRSLKNIIAMADSAGNLYLATLGALAILPAEAIAGGRLPSAADFKRLPVFPSSTMYAPALLADRDGLLWLGTSGYGLLKLRQQPRQFRHLLPSISLRSISPDGRGRAFFWTWLEQLRPLDLASGTIGAPLLPLDKFWCFDFLATRDGAGAWLIARARERDEGKNFIVKIDPQTLRPEAFFRASLTFGEHSQLIEAPDGRLWANGAGSRLACFDPRSGESQVFDFQKVTGFDENSFCPRFDRVGRLWLGTPHGLLRAEPRGGGRPDFAVFKNDPADRSTLASNFVLCSLDDPSAPNEHLWVGTKGGGLHLVDKKTGRVLRRFTTADGLPNNVVYGLLAPNPQRLESPNQRINESSNLWLSTNSGLCLFNPQGVHFQNFSASDGLQGDEFNTSSFAADPASGALFFGGVNGLTVFCPADIVSPESAPAVRITGLKIQNRSVRPGDGVLEKSLAATTSIALPHSKNQVTFEFAAMDFVAPKKNQYRYRLLGADKDWTEATTSNSATYANLAPGTYTFEVVTGGSRGVWGRAASRLEIKVLPPWWRTWLAYFCYALLLAGAAWQFYRFQIRRIKLQNERDFERREALRLAELDRLKTRFFSSVTHEFRTPLTLILEPVRQLLAEKEHARAHPRLHLVENNARRLLRYVSQLLDLGKIEGRQMSLELRQARPADVLQSMAEEFRPLAEKHGIQLIFKELEEIGPFPFDAGKVEQIAQNLLSNAIKFTPDGGRVALEIEKIGGREWQITVADTGAGIPTEDLPRVFERYFQSAAAPENAESRGGAGTGIGLALVKELAELLGGSVAAESQVGQGSIFRVVLPLSEPVVEASAAPVFLQKNAAERESTGHRALLSQEDLRVLVVEDNPELRLFVRQSLPQNWQIEEAADGAEGIEKAFELLPDLVISDVMMPRKDGLELTDALKNDPRTSHVPIMLLTAKAAVENRIAGLRRGADAYLTKPFHTEELVASAENLVATRRRLREFFSQAIENQSVRESVAALQDPPENEFLQKLLDVVERHLDDEEISVDGYARAMLMSRSQLNRKLSAIVGQSVNDFVRNHRLDRAREMLLSRAHSVQEVAARTGFSNSKYFSTVFRERFGVSPRETTQ